VRRLFEQKKNQGSCPNCPYQHPERTRPNVNKFTRKKRQILTCFLRRWARPTFDAPGSNIFAGIFFFLLLKERKRITVTFAMIFLFFN
jgi:hypothetical protein